METRTPSSLGRGVTPPARVEVDSGPVVHGTFLPRSPRNLATEKGGLDNCLDVGHPTRPGPDGGSYVVLEQCAHASAGDALSLPAGSQRRDDFASHAKIAAKSFLSGSCNQN